MLVSDIINSRMLDHNIVLFLYFKGLKENAKLEGPFFVCTILFGLGFFETFLTNFGYFVIFSTDFGYCRPYNRPPEEAKYAINSTLYIINFLSCPC